MPYAVMLTKGNLAVALPLLFADFAA